jgi:hypothetical protein
VYRRPIIVTPVDSATGRPDQLRSFPAFGVDISANGVCFVARQLVAARKAVIVCEGPDELMASFLFEPRWVRFTRGGWYHTGGRLLEVLPSDSEPNRMLRLAELPPS